MRRSQELLNGRQSSVVSAPRESSASLCGCGGGEGTAAGAARTLREIEMEHVLRVLEKHGGSKALAAQELGISLKTMYNKLNQLQEERKAAG